MSSRGYSNNIHGTISPSLEFDTPNERVNKELHFFSKNIADHPVIIYQPTEMSPRVSMGVRFFHKLGCPMKNCILTNLDIHKLDADVLFFSENAVWDPPVPRNPSQIWIIRLLESPENTFPLNNFDNLINYTASYRSDSDIYAPYGLYEPFQAASYQTPQKDFSQGKTKLVAWFVSHCLTNNRRMEYARDLSRYVKVDIYGDCGKSTLTKKDGNNLLKNTYKFYLAFENSNCNEYITEKFWQNALENNIVPIVMGATKDQYLRVAPHHSFIHVDDYTPGTLAQYLKYLDKNATAYNEYFAWKNHGRLTDSFFYCRLCSFVQNPKPKVYENIDHWWRKEKCNQKKFVF